MWSACVFFSKYTDWSCFSVFCCCCFWLSIYNIISIEIGCKLVVYVVVIKVCVWLEFILIPIIQFEEFFFWNISPRWNICRKYYDRVVLFYACTRMQCIWKLWHFFPTYCQKYNVCVSFLWQMRDLYEITRVNE